MTILEKAGAFTRTLGSWWSGEYDGRDEIHTFVDALVHVARSQHELLDVVLRSVDVYAVAPFRYSQFQKIKIYLQTNKEATIRYDTGLEYDAGWKYDQAVANGNVFTVDFSVVKIASIIDKPGATEWALTSPFDFSLENGKLVLTQRAAKQLRDVYAVQAADTAAPFFEVWARGVETNYDDVFAAFGAVHQLYGKSSHQYARVVQAYHRCLVSGSTQGTVLEFIGACVDEPLTRHASETVEAIYTNGPVTTVITNREVYKHASEYTTVVQEQQILPRHTLLSDRLTIYPSLADLPVPCVAIPAGWLPACVGDAVYLSTSATPLIVNTAESFTKVTWAMPGNPRTVKQFFNAAYASGVSEATPVPIPVDGALPPENVVVRLNTSGESWYQKATLAHALDTRKLSVGEPTAAHLPAEIVPAAFVSQNIMQNAVWGLYIRGDFSTRNTQYAALAKLSQVLPPQTGLYLLLEPLDTGVSVPHTSVVNSVQFADAADAVQESIPTTAVSYQVQFVDIV